MRRSVVVGVIALAVLAGCGESKDDNSSGGGGSSSDSPTKALADRAGLSGKVNTEGVGVATAKGGKLEVELDDFYFGPAFIKAPAGSALHLEIKNEGKAPHTFTIDSMDIDETVAPGKTTEVDVTVPAKGAVAMYCRFHKDKGMQGAIVVTG